jgi:hypothetical protein
LLQLVDRRLRLHVGDVRVFYDVSAATVQV